MNHPLSTYRIQFHKAFSFTEFEKIVGYLHKLGVGSVYASPIFRSLPGSTHGYDTLNPHEINPEIGDLTQFRRIASLLAGEGMGWMQDIVPNHMAFSPDNPWIFDLMKKGRASWYAGFFDIDWDHPSYDGKLMLPFLGKSFDDAVKDGDLKLVWKDQEAFFDYFGNAYPLNEASVEKARSTDDLAVLHGMQYYCLTSGSLTDQEINFRRFFTVNALICLNMQDERVFQHFHQFIKQLHEEGLINGLRIDHIDGLSDPKVYLDRLRSLAGPDTYVVAEKILEPNEGIPVDWPLQGTTGYDFMAMVNNLLTWCPSQDELNKIYQSYQASGDPFNKQLHDCKRSFLQAHMAGEWDNLYRIMDDVAPRRDRPSEEDLRAIIGEFLVYCPVYRFYGSSLPLDRQEADAIKGILDNITADQPGLKPAAQYLESLLIDKLPEGEPVRMEQRAAFYRRLMQFCAPLMAKGFEDTLMYRYFRLLAHNEVGDSPDSCGITPDAFHKKMKARAAHWRNSLNATATHDTKRGEDARARINTISQLPAEWKPIADKAMSLLEPDKGPDQNDAYFILQTIVGHYPFAGCEEKDFEERLQAYVEKALRESKRNSSWSHNNLEYEQAAKTFALKLWNDQGFREVLHESLPQFMDLGIINSLQQTVLKFVCPGIPDTYQGTELWDLSFVDPDNRRPVDYTLRAEKLNAIIAHEKQDDFYNWLWEQRYSGEIKLWLTYKLMHLRRDLASLFADGEYLTLKTTGKFKDHLLAFGRKYRKRLVITVIPIHTGVIGPDIRSIDWEDTAVEAPSGAWGELHCLVTGKDQNQGAALQANHLFRQMPFAILQMETLPNPRGAGVLMHISSLPSLFGIGDMGPAARSFANFLYRAKQSYWQILPLNPTEGGQGNSPYSSTSSRAGNMLFISPELLVRDGLLSWDDIKPYKEEVKARADYGRAEDIRKALLQLAWERYRANTPEHWKEPYQTFLDNESEWLHDYALFVQLKRKHGGRAWYDWEQPFKFRDPTALRKLEDEEADALECTRWIQFVFSKQWEALKTYCNSREIQMVGDMPFYVSYDSADVWAHPELFALDDQGNRKGLAGVPPDVFSADGQLWGMPVFDWDKLKATGYEWWLQRLKKNMNLFDLTRLDHFRAFYDYWEVPVDAPTAKFGTWKPGPGPAFFDAVLHRFGSLPFIAEDLGEISGGVDDLRTRYQLPGMRVLQFAFGDDMPEIGHVPHHHQPDGVVYTGTHDNDTAKGWWRQEGADVQANFESYIGRPLHEDEVADLLCRMAYASVCRMAVIPVQDIIGLDETARMNRPGNTGDNWNWRLLPDQLKRMHEEKLQFWIRIYDRI